ncbi:MAG: hypothetical protein K2X25_07125 [Caulobacteraceae bacterium]|nr:hypothetical protein [Caulobacteraceae bacterium]
MSDDRVVAFKRPTKEAGVPVSGRMTFKNSQLFIPVMRTEFPPRWAVKDGQITLADGSVGAISVCLVAESVNDAGPMGYLDRDAESFAGEFAVGEAHMQVVRHAAFSPVAYELTVDVSAAADGQIVELRLGVERAA